MNIVPLVLSDGIALLAGMENGPVRLDDPEIVQAPGVTHVRCRVKCAQT